MIGFWKNDKKNYTTHAQGLSKEQVSFLQGLQIGDRLVLFENDVREGEKRAPLTLKRSTLKKSLVSAETQNQAA